MSAWRLNVQTLIELLRILPAHFNGAFKIRLGLVLLLVCLSASLGVLVPVALKRVLDGLAGSAPPISPLWMVGLYVSSMWVARLLISLRSWVYAQLEWRLYRAVGDQVFDHIMRLPLRFHLERQTGGITQAVMNGLAGCRGILQHAVFTVVPVIVELGMISLVLINMHDTVYLPLFLAALVSYGLVFMAGSSKSADCARVATTAYLHATAVMTDSILNYEVVKYFTAEDLVRKRFDDALGDAQSAGLRFNARSILNGLRVATVYGLFLGVTLLYAAWQVQRGRMTVGGFILINAYMQQLTHPVELLGSAAQQFIERLAAVEKLLALLGQQAEQRHVPPVPAPGGAGAVEFRNVRFGYNCDRVILKGVSFHIPAGKTVAIVGASGSGKSSLVRLLFGFHDDYRGEILLDGVPISSLPLAKLRSCVAVVPQDTALFNDTIAFNIAVGREGSSLEEIENAAKTAALHDFIMQLPQRYHTQVGERGVKLSGGEKQRISIARAVLKRPAIYVFDEATSSLDSRVEQEILQNLRQISRHSTTLVIAHRLSTIADADEIVVLDGGVTIERGTHGSLMSLQGKYAQLWHAQKQASSGQPAERDPRATGYVV